ncbi:MAG: T9SS type A sorting domain-containing protein, partial [Paludibacter sp.]
YALPSNEIAQLSGILSKVEDVKYSSESNLTLWPLPANDMLNVSWSSANNSDMSTLKMFDTYGRLVMNKEIKYTSDLKLNVSDLPSGIYLLKLTTGKETLMKKLIINH